MSNNLPHIKNCPFEFKCKKNWDDMAAAGTSSSGSEIRFCSACNKKVYQSVNIEELVKNANLNRCVMIEIDDGSLIEMPVMTTGLIRPEGNSELRRLLSGESIITEDKNKKPFYQRLKAYLKSLLSAKP